MSRLRLVIATHDRKVLDAECDEVTLPGTLGYFGILPEHVPLISTLAVGELRYRIGKQEHFLVLKGGFCEVFQDEVTVLAEVAELPDEIDVAAAEIERTEAEVEIRETGEGFYVSQAKLELAITRIQVAGKHHLTP
jgi:F-type H+-transporting ATPase subunit epsilon